MRKVLMMLAIGGAALLAVPAQAQKVSNPARDMMQTLGSPGLRGKALDEAIRRAEAQPLGSAENPIRENQPQGEHAYLARLRCADGSRPSASRDGNVGDGIYGNIVDLYTVTCAGQPAVKLYMDMYQDGPETRPVPGFTMSD